jgi:transcriptional regulator with XRE-family HTH domain
MSFVIVNLVIIMNLRIRDMREDADLTQQQVAEYLMCDQSLYSKYERGERPVPLETIVKLAHLYKTSVDYLVGLTNKKHLIEEYEYLHIT